MLELLLQRRELGKRRVGIRFLVLPILTAAERLGVILLALGAFDAVTLAARRAIAAAALLAAIGALLLPVYTLLARVAILALLPILALAVAAETLRLFSSFGGRRGFGGGAFGRQDRGFLGGALRTARPMRTTWSMPTTRPVGPVWRAPRR